MTYNDYWEVWGVLGRVTKTTFWTITSKLLQNFQNLSAVIPNNYFDIKLLVHIVAFAKHYTVHHFVLLCAMLRQKIRKF